MYTDDSQVIGAVLHGDKNRYEELIQKYKRMVYGIAWSHLGDYDLSEDAAQETFVKAYSYLGTLRNPNKFPGWLARIARNVCHSFGRQAKQEAALAERWALEASQPQEEDRESLEEQLQHSFASLSAIHREALTIFYIEDKSLRQSSAILGISESALKARLFRARAALRVQLEQRLEDTLESLEPSKDFNRRVLALLPLAPKGLAGAGGLLAFLGKLSAALSFALWTGLLQSSLTSGMVYLHFRADAANIKDKPENAHIRKNIMRNGLIVVASMGTVMLIMPLFMVHFDLRHIFKALAVLNLFIAALMARRLRVNTSPYMLGDTFSWAAMAGTSFGLGFLNAPIESFFIIVILIGVVGFFTHHKRQSPTDVHLLLGTTGDLSREQLKVFARFLGGYGFIIDYRFRGDSIVLIIPEIRASFAAHFTKRLSSGSSVLMRPDGTCTSHRSPTDLKSLEAVHNRSIGAETAESDLCQTVTKVLQALLRSDLQAATSILAPPVDGNVFKRDPLKLNHWRVHFVITIVFMIGFLIWIRLSSGQWFHPIPAGHWPYLKGM